MSHPMTDEDHNRVNTAACAITQVAALICKNDEGLVACAVMEAFATMGCVMTPEVFARDIQPRLALLHKVMHERWQREADAGEAAEAAVAKARESRPTTEWDKP